VVVRDASTRLRIEFFSVSTGALRVTTMAVPPLVAGILLLLSKASHPHVVSR
jgi:hypothetical protein